MDSLFLLLVGINTLERGRNLPAESIPFLKHHIVLAVIHGIPVSALDQNGNILEYLPRVLFQQAIEGIVFSYYPTIQYAKSKAMKIKKWLQ